MGFVVSVTNGGRMRRLHFAGGRHRVPGEHFKLWESLGQAVPSPHLYTARCRDDFPLDAREDAEAEASDSDGSTASSSTSAASGAGAAADF